MVGTYERQQMSERDLANSGGASRLDGIATQLTLLRLAREGSVNTAAAARNMLVMRYVKAIRRYLGALLRNDDDADESSQEVVVKILRGDFSGANPERGRFRDYLKAAVRNVGRTYLQRRQRQPNVADVSLALPEAAFFGDTEDTQWLENWRAALLESAWDTLKLHEQENRGSLAFQVLRLVTDHPDDTSDQLAARLAEKSERPIRPAAVRQQIHRARGKFARYLWREVGDSLDDPTVERIEAELAELGLMDHVRDFLPADRGILEDTKNRRRKSPFGDEVVPRSKGS